MYNYDEERLFSSRASQGLCSHAYIVDGEEGIGKLDFALYCARTMLCTEKHKPCSYCENCRKALEGGHPDIYIIGQEKTASIADVRELIRRSGLKPNDADKQIFIVCNAGKLRSEAQNALLKIFEEPPETVAMFLLTDSRASLLPTVLSRGQRIHLDGMSDSQLEAALAKKHPNLDKMTLRSAVEMASGNLKRAEGYLSKENVALREKSEKLLGFLLTKNSYEVCAMLAAPKHKRENIYSLLGEFAALISEAQKQKYCSASGRSISNAECAERLKTASKKTLATLGELAICAMEALENNANVTAVTSKLSIDLLRAAAK